MEIVLQCDTRAQRDVNLTTIVRELESVMSNAQVSVFDVGDRYGKYQVDERLNPQAIASEYEMGDVSTPARLVLTGYDLKPPNLHFAFGATQAGVVSVVSTSRMKQNSLYAAVTSAHELFHQFGLVRRGSPQYDHRNGMAGHCDNRHCLMRAVNSLTDLQGVASDWSLGIRLCSLCRGM
jgi:predicted Zn-dependent protease